MRFRHVLPVAVLSVLVLALALTYTGGVADAAENALGSGTAVSQSTNDNTNTNGNNNHNVNHSRVENIVEVKLDLSDLQLGSASKTIDKSVETWFNRAEIEDQAYNGAIGVNQATVVSGSGNIVRQSSLAVYMDAETINIGNESSSLL